MYIAPDKNKKQVVMCIHAHRLAIKIPANDTYEYNRWEKKIKRK